jgi:hypothetical protein
MAQATRKAENEKGNMIWARAGKIRNARGGGDRSLRVSQPLVVNLTQRRGKQSRAGERGAAGGYNGLSLLSRIQQYAKNL